MSDWFEAEWPMSRALVVELQRLRRRAFARPLALFGITLAATAALIGFLALEPKPLRARVIIAVTEGELASQRSPTPPNELREYFSSVLLPNPALTPLLDEYPQLFPLRRTHGDAYAYSELRDLFEIEVWQNYFLFEYSNEERRSARIAITVTHPDRETAISLARRLATMAIEAEAARRRIAAEALAHDAAVALERARERLAERESQASALVYELTQAERAGKRGRVAVLQGELQGLWAQLRRDRAALGEVRTVTSTDQLDAAVSNAGLGLDLAITDERLPPRASPLEPYLWAAGTVATFLLFLPVVMIALGAFDRRIHDGDDVRRLGMDVLGHLPGFAGDKVGSLRARGLPPRRFGWRTGPTR